MVGLKLNSKRIIIFHRYADSHDWRSASTWNNCRRISHPWRCKSNSNLYWFIYNGTGKWWYQTVCQFTRWRSIYRTGMDSFSAEIPVDQRFLYGHRRTLRGLPKKKDEKSSRRVTGFFSMFYAAINAGSLLSTFISPILREDVSCLGSFSSCCVSLK